MPTSSPQIEVVKMHSKADDAKVLAAPSSAITLPHRFTVSWSFARYYQRTWVILRVKLEDCTWNSEDGCREPSGAFLPLKADPGAP